MDLNKFARYFCLAPMVSLPTRWEDRHGVCDRGPGDNDLGGNGFGKHRRLAEVDDFLASGAAMTAAFAVEKQRVDARVKRLKRSRNATIHGGPVSEAACGTITDFAKTLAQQALNNTIWAFVIGQQVDSYAMSRRHEYRQRILKLSQGGDLANLFILTS